MPSSWQVPHLVGKEVWTTQVLKERQKAEPLLLFSSWEGNEREAHSSGSSDNTRPKGSSDNTEEQTGKENPNGIPTKQTPSSWNVSRYFSGAIFVVVVQSLSCVQLFATPCPSPSPGVCSNSCPLSRWCHAAVLSCVVPFSSCPQSFPASGSFPVSWLFISDGQSIRNSASASVLPMSMKGWIPLELTGSISLLSKGLSRVFSSTTIQRHQFFGAQPSLWSNLQIHTWLRDAIFSLS